MKKLCLCAIAAMICLIIILPARAGDGQIGTYTCYGLTGGDAGDLDKLPYADLNDKDAALVFVAGDATYFYTFAADSEAAESSPDVIAPDDATGAGRWILTQVHGGVAGEDGEDAYVYIAYASDASGTGFTLTFNAALDYIAILSTDTEIETPAVGDFAGLWKNYKGATGAAGPAGPAGADGEDGEDGAPGIQGDPGPAGADGEDGADGTNGYSVLSGSGAPGSGLGVNGDWYIDTAAHDIYGPKAAGAWGSPTSLIGPEGDQGIQGDPGEAGPAGADGEDGITYTWRNGTGVPDNGLGINGDYYLDDATGDVYFKAAGTYSVVANMQGPQGEQGEPGENAVDWTVSQSPAVIHPDNYEDIDTDDQTASEVSVTDTNDYFAGETQEEINAEIGSHLEVPSSLGGIMYSFGSVFNLTISWDAPLDNRVTDVEVFRAEYPGDFGTVPLATVDVSETDYTDTTGLLDTWYQYKVRSTDGVTPSDFGCIRLVYVNSNEPEAMTAANVSVVDTEENFTGTDAEAVFAEIWEALVTIVVPDSLDDLSGDSDDVAEGSSHLYFPGFSGLDPDYGFGSTVLKPDGTYQTTPLFPSDFGTGNGNVCEGDDSRLSDARTPTTHAGTHTDGSDDIQSASSGQKGLMTSTQASKLDGIEASADVTDATNVAAAIHGVSGKTTPVDADELGLIDSAASNVLKVLTWANLKATLKTYFDGLYATATIEISVSTSTTLTITGNTVVDNSDQSGAITTQLPSPPEDTVFVQFFVTKPTETWYIDPATDEYFYLSGTQLSANHKIVNNGAGSIFQDSILFESKKDANDVWVWVAYPVQGTWTDGGL